MKKIIFLTGRSGSGKSAIANKLNRLHGLNVLDSYTDRPKRYNDEKGHIFVSEKQFDLISKAEISAYSVFDGHRYCAVRQQILENDVYIIDKNGIEYYRNKYGDRNYDGVKVPIIIYIDVSPEICRKRMMERKDSIEKINKRFASDEREFENIRNYADYTVFNDNLIETVSYIYDIYSIHNSPKCLSDNKSCMGYKSGRCISFENCYMKEEGAD